MAVLNSILMWIFTESIYGSSICAVIVAFLAVKLERIFPRCPNPFILAAITFIVALFTLPSIPRYQFEKSTLADISSKPWVRVINQTKLGDVIEPLTWVSAPVGSFFLAMPFPEDVGLFRELSLRYKEENRAYNTRPSCENHMIQRTEINSEDKFRHMPTSSTKMTEFEINAYCNYDWKKERVAIKSVKA